MNEFSPSTDAAVHRVTRRRMGVLTFVVFMTGLMTLIMADFIWGMPMRGWNGVQLLLFAVLSALISFGAGQAIFGFIARRGGGDLCRLTRSLPPEEEPDIPLAPTAIVMPIFNEDVARVFAGLRAIYRSVERTGQIAQFDFYVLSDSTDPNKLIAEEIAWAESRRELDATGRFFYRKLRTGTNKKAGNIADFCRRWGRRYRYMVVLDADSFMAGDLLVRLVRLMERNPGTGIIQTAPSLVRAETLYARVMQFATRLYGPVFLAGLNYWQQGEGNYWGHNAIIRVAPFMEHCALPKLPGREPIGGRILSHDFVEAALLRRAGWAVWMLAEAEGSFEEGPPTLIDAAKRDRRWCQGNLQHGLLLLARGLPTISRIHFLLGIMSYAASLFWLTLLLLGSLILVGFGRTGLTWVPKPGFAATLGVNPAVQSGVLVGMTLLLLFGPKLLAVIDLIIQRGGTARFGGFGKVLAGVFLESLFSALQAPILMLLHAKFVVLTVLGRGVGWATQRRDGEGRVNWSELFRVHAGHTAFGLGWAAILAFGAPRTVLWMLPVLAGMILAIPFSLLTSRTELGRWTRARGLFCTPEELILPVELAEVEKEIGEKTDISTHQNEDDGLIRTVLDPYTNALHLCLLHERSGQTDEIRRYFEENRERLLHSGPGALPAREKSALLADAESIDWLHRELWRRRPQNLAAEWQAALQQNKKRLISA